VQIAQRLKSSGQSEARILGFLKRASESATAGGGNFYKFASQPEHGLSPGTLSLELLGQGVKCIRYLDEGSRTQFCPAARRRAALLHHRQCRRGRSRHNQESCSRRGARGRPEQNVGGGHHDPNRARLRNRFFSPNWRNLDSGKVANRTVEPSTFRGRERHEGFTQRFERSARGISSRSYRPTRTF
jgi:hypothetical protein